MGEKDRPEAEGPLDSLLEEVAKVKVRGEVGEDVPSRYFSWGRSFRERLGYLAARYLAWYRHEASRAWRGRHGPEPTLEALLDWGRGRGEWSVLEESLVPGLLREILEERSKD